MYRIIEIDLTFVVAASSKAGPGGRGVLGATPATGGGQTVNKSKLPKEFEDVTGRYDEEEANIVCELCHQYDPPPDMNLPGKGTNNHSNTYTTLQSMMKAKLIKQRF